MDLNFTFTHDVCPRCGRVKDLIFNNNPLLSSEKTICFDCVSSVLKYDNLSHADFFCRTYNLPFNPDVWMGIAEDEKENTFKRYNELVLTTQEDKRNLYYTSSTSDLWEKSTKEWQHCRSFVEIINNIEPIKDMYVRRGHMKWGEQYTFNEIYQLDSLYAATLKSNNVTDPMQKQAIKKLCKLNIEIDQAIAAKNTKAIADFSKSWSTFAKQADLDSMITESRTGDIVTAAELWKYAEEKGFEPWFYDNTPRDEVDFTIKDLKDTLRRLIIECTGLQPAWEDALEAYARTKEDKYADQITSDQSLDSLLNFDPEAKATADMAEEIESDEEIEQLDFTDEKEPPLTIVRKGDAAK